MRLVDRVACIRKPFPKACDAGCDSGAVARRLADAYHSKLLYMPNSLESLAEQERLLNEPVEEGDAQQAVSTASTSTASSTSSTSSSSPPASSIGKPTSVTAEVPTYFNALEGLQQLTVVDSSPIFTTRAVGAVQDVVRAHAAEVALKQRGASSSGPSWSDLLGGVSMLRNALGPATSAGSREPFEVRSVISDLEKLDEHLERDQYDLITSSMAMHWVNDLPNFLNGVCILGLHA